MSNNSMTKIFDKVKFFDKVKIAASGISTTPVEDPYFAQTVLLLKGDGQTNDTFLDSSTNNLIIARNRTPTQNLPGPFQSTRSVLFNGTSDYLRINSTTPFNFDLADFTIECWVNVNRTTGSHGICDSASSLSGQTEGKWRLGIENGNITFFRHGSGGLSIFNHAIPSFNTNTWYHIVVSRQSGVFYLFLDGQQVSTSTLSVNFNDAGGLNIGAIAASTFLAGYISNLRITKGVARYTSNFTPSETLVSNTSTTPVPVYSLSRSVSSVDEDSSVTFTLSTAHVVNGTNVPYTITGISANDLSSGSLTGNFTVNNSLATTSITLSADQLTEGAETATLALNNGAASIAVLVNDTSTTPVGDPSFAQTTLLIKADGAITDLSSYNNTINIVGNASVSTAVKKYGTGSIAFDGNGDYLTIPASNNFNLGTGDFTVEAWVYMLPGGSKYTLINTQPHNTLDINLNRTGIGNTFVYIGNGSSWFGGGPAIVSSDNLSFNAWHHVALVRNGGTITLFHNGTSVGNTTNTPSGFNGGIYIGSGFTNAAIEFFNGYIDDLRITKGLARYTSNFTPSEALGQ